MGYNITNARVIVEPCVAAVAGAVWITLTSYLDLDAPISPYGYLSLLAIGFALGCFGRSPVLLIGPATSVASMYFVVDLFLIDHVGPKGFLVGLGFGGFLFLFMSVVVLIGAVIGRGLKRYWMKKKAKCAA